MNTRQRTGWVTIALGVLATAASITMVGGSASAGVGYPSPNLADSQQVDLHANTASIDNGDCPNDSDQWWHFLIPPNGGQVYSMVEVYLVIDGVNGNSAVKYTPASADYELSSSGHLNSFFIKVPAGASYTDLVKAGSYVVATPASPETELFNLSHICAPDGGGESTTTTTEAATTTTEAATTTSVASEGPNPTTTTEVQSEAVLPSTGSNGSPMLLTLGGLLLGLGTVVLVASRRTAV